ncbi:hypothetical protein LTR64_006957 [Lithohypha guttulata]|uniref:uncharacterized protein n=1 Tax=Lithohypha guttulata TaxID=1690604 RepID=UPI00315D2BB3
MKFGETLYQRSVPKWAAYNLNYNELKKLIKQRTTNGAAAPVPIPGQSDHRWSLLEDEFYGILKEQYDNIGMFLRSKYGETERRLAYLDKTVKSAKRAAKQYAGRPSLQARRYQRLAQEAESIGEDIQALSRFATVQKIAFRKILKKYRKWTKSDALRARLEVGVFCDGQLELNVSEQMQHLAAQISVIERLQADLFQPGSHDQGQNLSTTKIESPVSRITKHAQAGALYFDAAVASVPFGEAAGTATYWIHMDDLEEAKVLLLRYMRDLNLPYTLLRNHSMDNVTEDVAPPASERSVSTCYFDNVYRFIQDQSTHSPSKIAMCALWSHEKEALITLSDMSPKSDHNSTLAIRRKDLQAALDRDLPAPKERSSSAANVSTVKDFLSQHRDLKALALQDTRRLRLVGLNNSAEVGTFATLDTNVSFRPFNKDILEASNNDIAEQQPFPHAVLQIRWEFGRKPEVSRRTRRTTEPASGTTSGPSSTGDSVFSAVPEHSAGSETSPVTSMNDLRLAESTSEPTTRKKKKARIDAESPTRTARYYSEYDDPGSELYQQEAYTIYIDPDAEALGMATLKKIRASAQKTLNQLWTTTGGDKSGGASERSPLLTDRSSADEGEQSSESDGETAPSRPKHNGLKGHIRPAERYRMRLSRRQRGFERTRSRMSAGLVILSYVLLLMSATLLATGRRKEYLEVDVGATIGVVVSFICMLLSLGIVYTRKTPMARVEKVAIILATVMNVLLTAAVVVGIIQKAERRKQ